VEWELLRGLSADEVEQVLAAGRRRRFAKREVVWHEGDRAETIHLITTGRVAIRAATSFGEVITVIVFGPGDVAGLVGAEASEPDWTTTGVTLEPTETVSIRHQEFVLLRRRMPKLNEAVVRFMADRTLGLTLMLVDALYVAAEKRVLRQLALMARVYSTGEDEVTIPLTQEDLATMAGVTRPTVNRVLMREQNRGALRTMKGRLVVTDREAIARRAR
jgi:CRP/FNR family cyclic AMP-dependent transcriptional regulator